MNRILVGLGTCGIAAGAQETYRALEDRLALKKLPWKLAKTGCLGMCFQEPMVEFRTSEGARFTYGAVTADRIDRLLEEHVVGERRD